jgi:hypothetical protein
MNKVLLCVTLKTDLWPTWFQKYNEIEFFGPNFQTEVMTIYDFRADEARNKAFWQFQEQKQFTHILFLDSDLCIPKDTIPRLLAHNKDIVGGLYMLKTPPFPPTMYVYHKRPDADGKGFIYRILLDYRPGDLIKVDGLATGCMMVSRKAVEEILHPWFSFNEGGTEDIYFCRRADKHGFEIYCDTSIECSHLRIVAVSPNDYWAHVRKMGGIEAVKTQFYQNFEEKPWKQEGRIAQGEGQFGEVPA